MGWFRWRRGGDPRQEAFETWRRRWEQAVSAPSQAVAAALRTDLAALGGDEEAREIEREMLEGLDSLVELQARLATGPPPAVVTGHRAVGAETCYFSAPASLPDEAAQPSGTWLLTGTRAVFIGGSRGLTVPWHAVRSTGRQDRDVLLIRSDRPDVHRVRLNGFTDALRAAALAEYLRRTRRV